VQGLQHDIILAHLNYDFSAHPGNRAACVLILMSQEQFFLARRGHPPCTSPHVLDYCTAVPALLFFLMSLPCLQYADVAIFAYTIYYSSSNLGKKKG
jgi:hypothetical protein